MTVVITTNEPKEIRDLFPDRVEIPMDFDFLLYAKTTKLPMERKKVPGDLLASVSDGRLIREIQAMRQESRFYIILLHGRITYRKDGTVYVRGHHGKAWTKTGVRNLLRTLQFVEGCFIEYAESDEDLVEVVNELQKYFDEDKHLSLRHRPGLQTDWLVSTRQEKVMYFYAGLPGISVIRAKSLAKTFPSPLNLYQASVEDIQEISGFGKTLASNIHNFLREG